MDVHFSTRVTFPGGALAAKSKVLLTQKLSAEQSGILLVTETTPFHPLDYNWPDQPADKGMIILDGKNFKVENCLMAAIHRETHEFLLDQTLKEKKLRRDDPNWYFLVAHIIENNTLDFQNKEITLEVDAKYREGLSQSHTACHIAALALNQVTARFWKKAIDRVDSLGFPSLDGEAITLSKIDTTCSTDKYRCGKTLRKRGFDDALFFQEAEFKQVETELNHLLHQWCSDPRGFKIEMTPKEAFIHERRDWICIFPDGKKAVIPCGGTHLTQLPATAKISVSLQRDGDAEFVMTTEWV